jgi:hypothetical protein
MFKLLVVGRANADLVLNGFEKIEGEKEVILRKGKKEFRIRTNSTPSRENDKVTALESLDGIVSKMNEGEDYLFRWGGGGLNSAKTAATSSVLSQDMSVNFLTTARPDLFLGNTRKDLKGFLQRHEINPYFLCSEELGYNLIQGGEYKLVIRNPTQRKSSSLSIEDRLVTGVFVEQASGILVNAINDRMLNAEIAQQVYNKNDKAEYSPPSVGPRFRKVLTVLTPGMLGSYSRREEAMTDLIEEIIPYTGLIMNEEDLVKIFYANNSKPDKEHKMALEVMAKLRYGLSRPIGTKTKIVDPIDNIYVTLGREGYLLATDKEYYHLKTDEERTRSFDSHLSKSKLSVTGAGDAFAAGAIHQETLEEKDYLRTSAMINTVIARQLDHTVTVHPNQITTVSKGNLQDYYSE